MQRNSDGHKNLSNTSTSCSYTATNNATYQQEHMQKDQNMLNPANIEIKTVESRKKKKRNIPPCASKTSCNYTATYKAT